MKYAPHAILAVLVASLLAGQRFGFAWAGGEGYRPERGADVVGSDERFRSGEWIMTGTNERVKITIGTNNQIALDQNTDLALVKTIDEETIVHLRRGRIYATGALTINTNFTSTTVTEGAVSIVNYDFREIVSIVPIGTSADIVVENGETFTTEKPVDIHETSPVSVTEASFDPTSGAAADFYAWAIE